MLNVSELCLLPDASLYAIRGDKGDEVLDLRLVHVVRDFRSWDVVTIVRYFFYSSFSIFGPLSANRVKVKVFGDKSPHHVQRLESSNYKFESSKNNVP